MNPMPALDVTPASPLLDKTPSCSDIEDPLLECLLAVVALHDRTLSRETARAGLPLEDNRLSPALVARAAKRADMAAKIVRQPLGCLNERLFPAILLLKNQQASGSCPCIAPITASEPSRKPVGILPASPMNSLAGAQFQIKNPNCAAASNKQIIK